MAANPITMNDVIWSLVQEQTRGGGAYHDGGNGQPPESAVKLEGEQETVYQSHLSLSAARPLDTRVETYRPDMSVITPRDRSSQDPLQRTQRLTHLLNRQQQRIGSRNIDRLSPLNSSQPRRHEHCDFQWNIRTDSTPLSVCFDPFLAGFATFSLEPLTLGDEVGHGETF